MLRINSDDEYTIHLTRGDRCSLKVYAVDEKTQERLWFAKGDKVSFVIVRDKGYTKGDVLRKTVNVVEDTQEVEIVLTEHDTKIGDMIDKKTKYWYNVVINDNTTIIGSDENGEKTVIIYPEVGE